MQLKNMTADGGDLQRISSSSTGFLKWVFAPGWVLFLGCVISAGWMGLLDNLPSDGPLVLLTTIWLGLGSFFLWWAGRLEHVWLAGDLLVVLRAGREVRIPLEAVRAITESRWSRVKTVTVELEPGYIHGEKIIFVPPWQPLPFLNHPLVKDLYRRKRLAGSRYASLPELP
jgi:hypothetical protein